MEKLRICQMIDRPSLGGGQTALLLLAENLDHQLFEVFVCSASKGPLVEEVQSRGLTHIPVSLSKAFRLRTVKSIAAALEKNRIQILHTHGGIAGFYGRWAARRIRTPVIVHTLHGIHYLHYRNPLLKRLYVLQERIFLRFTDGLILVSQADLSQAKKHKFCPENKMFVIPNGVDLKLDRNAQDIQKKRLAWGWEREQPVIGTVARLHRQKGVFYLVKAAKKVLSAFPSAKIVVVGEGPLGQKLRKKTGKIGLEGRLLFLGERKDAAELISLFDVFVLPSLWEGLPFVLVEAAALGKPIIATAVDGVTEIIEDGKTGVLVSPKDPQALADAIIRLLQDKDGASRLAERAKAIIPARFPLRRMVAQTQNLYLELFARKKGDGSH
jgi:glycosyltransferase involved in cell wall biosynthesis